MAGPLFRELAEDISKQSLPSVLLTGHPDALKATPIDSLDIIAAPGYIRDSYMTRISSWVRYFVYVLFRCWSLPNDALMFLVSNPPFLGLVGYLFRCLRCQRYVVLVYDIYPDMLIKAGRAKESSLIVRLWRPMNRLVWENAEIIFTIGDGMAEILEKNFNPRKTRPGKVLAIPNWADTDWIQPIAKETNAFACKYGQVDKLTVMYSGNIGQTHDIETILMAVAQLKGQNAVHFMIIGQGVRKKLVEQAKKQDGLDNLTILPFQPEPVLPNSLPTADIAIVTLEKGQENMMVPSKTYYAMAAGSALIGLCNPNCDVARIINQHHCGIVVSPGDADTLVSEILDLQADPAKLDQYRTNSRRAAEKFYSRKNTALYMKALVAAGCLPPQGRPAQKQKKSFCKRIFDICISLPAMVVLSPGLIFLSLAIKLSDKGPVIFKQERAGKNGVPFMLYKFRTMKLDVDPFGTSPKSGDDPRLIKIGRFMREFSLDELPQLFNILKGDMSVVGPRPLYVSQIAEWSDYHKMRLQTKPGLTGLSQVCGRASLTQEAKLDLEAEYVQKQSFWLDIKIIFQTFAVVFGKKGVYEDRYSKKEQTRGDERPSSETNGR